MNIFMIFAVLALVPIGLAVVFLFRTLASRQDSNVSADQLLTLSPERYRPMERLLQEEDFRFLSSQPGFSPRLGRRFRTERRRIFRGYLRNLSKDFSRVSLACQMLVVHAADDRGDLAKSLMRLRPPCKPRFRCCSHRHKLLLRVCNSFRIAPDRSLLVGERSPCLSSLIPTF
jgi:hypothetical protein